MELRLFKFIAMCLGLFVIWEGSGQLICVLFMTEICFFYAYTAIYYDMALLAWKCNDYPKIRGKILYNHCDGQSLAFHKLVVDKSCGWVKCDTDMSQSRSSIKQNYFSPNWNYGLPGLSANNDGIYKDAGLDRFVFGLCGTAVYGSLEIKKKRVLWHLVHVCVILNISHNILPVPTPLNNLPWTNYKATIMEELAEMPGWESLEGYPRACQPEDTQLCEFDSLSLSCPHPLELLLSSGLVECL